MKNYKDKSNTISDDSETLNIHTTAESINLDINQDSSVTTMPDCNVDEDIKDIDKVFNDKRAKKKKIVTITLVTTLSVIFALIGAVGGYFLYNITTPKKDNIVFAAGEVATEQDIKNIQNSLSKNSILNDYKDNPYKLINYSLNNFANAKYSLVIGKGQAVAMGVSQNIESATFRTPDVIFNQNVSSSSVVSTANRYYDKMNNEVIQYECSKKEDWANASSTTANYDDYIARFGKLLSGIYYCTKDSEKTPISDKFLSLEKTEYESSNDASKFPVNSIIIYAIASKTINKSSLEKVGENYKVTLSLKKTGESYYSVQMKTTGGLKSAPVFDPSVNKLEFTLDSELNIISSVFTDKYKADVGLMSADTTQTLTQYYYHGDTPTFEGVEVKIPDISETEFNGYQLFK